MSSPAVVRRACVARTASSVPAPRRPTSCSPTRPTGASIRRPSRRPWRGVLDQVGWVAQVLVNQRTGHVVDGHLRVALAISRGEPSVPVLYVDLSEDEERLVLASLDPLAAMATTDEAKLRELLAEVSVDSEALAAMLAALAPAEPKDGLTDPDDIPEPPDEAVTQARRPLAPRRASPPLRRRRQRRPTSTGSSTA